MWKATERTAFFSAVDAWKMSCKRYLRKAFEDHLRVALIQPGSSRYEQIKVADHSAKRVEPRIIRPLQFLRLQGIFCYYKLKRYKTRRV